MDLYEVHGYLEEWIHDYESVDYAVDANRVTNQHGPLEEEKRICQGRKYYQSRKYLRSSSWESNLKSSRYIYVGIQLCSDP